MNYRHIYHAGNFADVFKHWILTLILEKLIEKPTAFCVLDTHAGLGLYDLTHLNAQKTLEQGSGIQRLVNKQLDSAFQNYFKIITELNSAKVGSEKFGSAKFGSADSNSADPIEIYPGSPKIIQYYLRSNDRMILSELHKEDALELQENFADDYRVQIFQQDGYITLKAVLPPAEKRGLVLMDPPFEQGDELKQLIAALGSGLKRFAHGIYAIWYPIKDPYQIKKFYNKLKELPITKAFYIELHANTVVLNQLQNCGMVIINPPWQLEQQLRDNMPKLLRYLEFDTGTYELEWLASEKSG